MNISRAPGPCRTALLATLAGALAVILLTVTAKAQAVTPQVTPRPALPALPQPALPQPAPAQPALASPEAKPEQAPRQSTLDKLFERLKSAGDAEEAKGIERQITRRWARSASDTADLLMSRAQEAAKTSNFPLAVELLDRIIVLEPDWAEGWNQRANVFFRMEDHVRAALDVAEALKREPRHFGALAGLAQMLKLQGADRSALKAYRRAYDIHPFLPGIKDQIDKLSPDAEGRDA
jgi:tetratricopeptide (TPR) repeat protein